MINFMINDEADEVTKNFLIHLKIDKMWKEGRIDER